MKREIRHFNFEVVQWRQRNVQKKCDVRAKVLFCRYVPILTYCFLDVLVAVAVVGSYGR